MNEKPRRRPWLTLTPARLIAVPLIVCGACWVTIALADARRSALIARHAASREQFLLKLEQGYFDDWCNGVASRSWTDIAQVLDHTLATASATRAETSRVIGREPEVLLNGCLLWKITPPLGFAGTDPGLELRAFFDADGTPNLLEMHGSTSSWHSFGLNRQLRSARAGEVGSLVFAAAITILLCLGIMILWTRVTNWPQEHDHDLQASVRR